MRIGSQGFHNYSRNLGRICWGSLEDATSQEARRRKMRRTLDELPWSIGETPVNRRDGSRFAQSLGKNA